MITKLISSKAILAKVLADNDMEDFSFRVTDIQEWIGEALEKISGVHTYGKKVSGDFGVDVVKLRGYQAPLPCDLHNLDTVAYSRDGRTWAPMRYSTGAFSSWDGCTKDEEGKYHYSDFLLAQIVMSMSKDITTPLEHLPNSLNYQDAISYLVNNPNAKKTLIDLLHNGDERLPKVHPNTTSTDQSRDLQYTVKPGWINTNVREGYLKLAYTAIPRDKEGYPLVPDNASVSEAIYWYATMKLLYPLYVKGKIAQQVYFDARTSWNYYCNQAYGNMLMPNSDGIESFKNAWLRIMPEINEHDTFDSHVGQEQIVYNHSSYYGSRI